MYTRYLLVFALCLNVSSCHSSRANPPQVESPDLTGSNRKRSIEAFPNLAAAPLPPLSSLTKSYYDKAYPNLNEDQLKLKWESAVQSPMMLIRSYVNTWYDEASLVPNTGPIGPCFGDPHVENFGFLWAEKWMYTYNDFDDVGRCPVLFDALRFFTTLSLYVNDATDEGVVRAAYLGFLKGQSLTEFASKSYTPDYDQLKNDILFAAVKDKKLLKTGESESLDADAQTNLFSQLMNVLPDSSNTNWLDARIIFRNSGGSAGLKRYRVLTQSKKDDLLILELKELTSPGSERGSWNQSGTLSRKDFSTLLWKGSLPNHMNFIELDEKPFLSRSVIKSSIDLNALVAKDRLQIFIEQAYIIAQIHRLTLNEGSLEGLDAWLSESTQFMVNRYSSVLKKAQK